MQCVHGADAKDPQQRSPLKSLVGDVLGSDAKVASWCRVDCSLSLAYGAAVFPRPVLKKVLLRLRAVSTLSLTHGSRTDKQTGHALSVRTSTHITSHPKFANWASVLIASMTSRQETLSKLVHISCSDGIDVRAPEFSCPARKQSKLQPAISPVPKGMRVPPGGPGT